MKKQLKSLLLVVVFAGILFPQRLLAQASTEGKEFWVALTLSIRPPGDGDGEATPYLAISTKEVTTITIENPNNPSSKKTFQVGANEWYKVPESDLPTSLWYPTGVGNPTNVKKHADEVNNYGVHIQADKNISVFAILRAGAGMDASNILPVKAIHNEYILQDYVPHAKNNDGPYITMATILATQDNTQITVNPSCPILSATTPKLVGNKITLNQGQTYYLMAENNGSNNNCLSGTEITADKNIAVFQGVPCTFVPHDVGNRDCLFEQAIPAIFWGTQFVATRSYAKGANIIRVTASVDGTTIDINGFPVMKDQSNRVMLQRGETYEIALKASDNLNNSDDVKRTPDYSIIGDHIYIETSCPTAVFSYDVGKGYNDRSATAEQSAESGHDGDPSSVWIAPLQQAIDQITFGLCGTNEDGGNQTKYHYLDLVVKTSLVNQTIITPAPEDPNYNPNNPAASFKPVEGAPQYSYARIYLAEADGNANKSYTISNPGKLVAHVYGNGKSESYAYSIGSAAVMRGVEIIGYETFTDEDESSDKSNAPILCINEDLEFLPTASTDRITNVEWDFGDGTKAERSKEADKDIDLLKVSHKYTSPGWYDIYAVLKGEPVCDIHAFTDTVKFTICIKKPQCLQGILDKRCLTLEEQESNPDSCAQLMSANQIVPRLADSTKCYSDTLLDIVSYKLETKEEFDQTERDSAFVFGKWYFSSQEGLRDTILNSDSCNHVRICNLTIITCLDLDIENDSAAQHPCRGDSLIINYTKNKGDINNSGNIGDTVLFICNDGRQGVMDTIPVKLSGGSANTSGTLTLPTSTLEPGIYKAKIVAVDYYCGDTIEYPIDITVYYPSDIFKAKFGNSLSVYNPGYGGNKIKQDKTDGDANNGWKFVAYQWYKDGQKIDSLTAQDPLYYTPYNDEGRHIKLEGVYYVELTREDGVKLKSCSQTFIDGKHPETKPAPAAQDEEQNDSASSNTAQKILQNRQIRILRDGHAYNIYGQKLD